MELVNRLVGGAGKTKPTPICPFLYHLYESKGLLTEDEETPVHEDIENTTTEPREWRSAEHAST